MRLKTIDFAIPSREHPARYFYNLSKFRSYKNETAGDEQYKTLKIAVFGGFQKCFKQSLAPP